MSRLVVVSNRVADPTAAQSGGLAVAVGDALQDGNGIWFGWSGEIDDNAEKAGVNLERPEIIAAVPDHVWLFDTLHAYDVVGFQTEQDLSNFERYVSQSEAVAGPVTHPFRNGTRRMTARTYPIGIDVDSFMAMASTPKAADRIRRLTRGDVRNHVIGVERLDYSKGLPDRFRSFQRFLEKYPDQRKKTVMMQIAPPTRGELAAYAEIRTELERLSGAINGEFGDFDWTPVRYIHRSVPRDTLAALFRGSKVGLVTPLRDGMNLVAKEYVAAQDAEDPGVLILSSFAGAAADLEEALIVNPYDPDEVAKALHNAVTMELDERLDRHGKLLARRRISSGRKSERGRGRSGSCRPAGGNARHRWGNGACAAVPSRPVSISRGSRWPRPIGDPCRAAETPLCPRHLAVTRHAPNRPRIKSGAESPITPRPRPRRPTLR